jgi:hypothetical protein
VGLSNGSYTDPSYYRGFFFVTAAILGYTSNQRTIPFGYLLHLLVQGHK